MVKLNAERVLLALVLLLNIAAFLGMCIYGAYTGIRGPTLLVNQYLGLWLTVILFFYTAQSIYIMKAPHQCYSRKPFAIVQYVYYALLAFLSFLICVGYGLYDRGDLSTWAVLTCIISLLNIYLVRQAAVVADDFHKSTGLLKALSIINNIFKVLMLLICVFLAVGAMTAGVGANQYLPRGKIVNVKLDDGSGRTQNFHFYCDGPKNDSMPVIIFEGSRSHGYADYLGLQLLFTERKLRSCSWDKAGLGFSDYAYADQHNSSWYYHNLVTATGEKGPFIFIGWGGGGADVYEYAAKHPENVEALIFLDVYPPQIEWISQKVLKNWTDAQYEAEVKADLNSRLSLFGIINGLGVPWGLMSVFVPPDKSWPEQLREERRWFMLTEKTWITQRWALEDLATDPNVFARENILDRISVSAMMSRWNDSQVERLVCQKRNLDEEKCTYEKKLNNYMFEAKRKLVKNGGEEIPCAEDDCNIGYFIYENPQFTVEKILEIYSKTNKTGSFSA